MAVSNAMFLFEVVVENVKSLVDSRHLIIKSDFGDIFSLELIDPKQMHIIMPEPLPLPPDTGKKGKKKPPKPKKKKKGQEDLPPPEPVIQSGQSVLFSSNAEFLIQTMKKYPLELALWSKEDNFTYIGATSVPWDPVFLTYLEKICNCEEPSPVSVNDEYNIFQEESAKLMAKLGIQVKLTYLRERVTTAFRTLSEDPIIKKVLYTGLNSKTTSYMCTMKTTDEDFEENCNKIENNFVQDKPKSNKMVFADYKGVPSANLTFFKEGDICCMGHVDNPPNSIYKVPETSPDIDFIVDYVRKIIISCNDNMRMLTPHPVIKPRIKATDIDRFCYCKETSWPTGNVADRFKKEVQSGPCPLCIKAGGKQGTSHENTFDIANIRGPCGRPDCRIARSLRAYIENLVEEDNKEIIINDIFGPCGSKECTMADKIKQILRHEGDFKDGSTLKGLSTQCACLEHLHNAFKPESCISTCDKNCNESEESSTCEAERCPFNQKPKNNVYNVYYFTVEHDFEKKSSGTNSSTNTNKTSASNQKTNPHEFCSSNCPSMKSTKVSCSKSNCTNFTDKTESVHAPKSKCEDHTCPSQYEYPPSPGDSDIVIDFDLIQKPCTVKSCDVAEKVKDYIVDGVESKKKKTTEEHPCYCDCVCDFNFSGRTTYCAVCGGYECLGDDVKVMPEYKKPHPCPVYHKTYNKKYLKVKSPWPDEQEESKVPESRTVSVKSSRGAGSKLGQVNAERKKSEVRSEEKKKDKDQADKPKKIKSDKKNGKLTVNVDEEALENVIEKKPDYIYPYPPVPKHMGWNWTAKDIPGMKPRPQWRPGAANRILVRRYRANRDGGDLIAKKRRLMLMRKKKLEMKPTLVITKRSGEYKVQMEVFKKYSKERLLYQYPYEEKPPLVYTIGKTEEEKQKIRKREDRRERRESRRKSRLIQSTFRDRCQEICLKAYKQAIGLLPLPNPNDPECPCHTDLQKIPSSIYSCSCSDIGSISSSDTDGDDWTIEFTPPGARWDAKAKHPPLLAENESQYNYLDFKVKLLDKSGNPVPRFFKGPDGKQECSDLGGFWGTDHEWLEINKDGYIGPDNRWVPMNFIGPDGMFYSAEEGGFTDSSGKYLKIGIDGYIEKDGKWAWYSRNRTAKSIKSKSVLNNTSDLKKGIKSTTEMSSKDKRDPKSVSASPVSGKGDKKTQPTPIIAKSQVSKEKTKKTVSYSTVKAKSPLVMNVLANYERNKFQKPTGMKLEDMKLLNKYQEIMQQLEMYDDICELKPLITTNRASNTPKKINISHCDKLNIRCCY